MNALFISDLHLSEERPHITAAFFAFLYNKTQDCERLYILGDFLMLGWAMMTIVRWQKWLLQPCVLLRRAA
ncbi:MAG: hypothetical protein R3E61_05545 [Pseudomonadales bacterium]